jgi:hypothetical protein
LRIALTVSRATILPADRSLNRNVEHLARDQLLELLDERAAARRRLLARHDERKRVDRLGVEQDLELDEVAFAVGRSARSRARRSLWCSI